MTKQERYGRIIYERSERVNKTKYRNKGYYSIQASKEIETFNYQVYKPYSWNNIGSSIDAEYCVSRKERTIKARQRAIETIKHQQNISDYLQDYLQYKLSF